MASPLFVVVRLSENIFISITDISEVLNPFPVIKCLEINLHLRTTLANTAYFIMVKKSDCSYLIFLYLVFSLIKLAIF